MQSTLYNRIRIKFRIRYISLFLFSLLLGKVQAQKNPIDFETLDQWEWFSERKMSNDGKWAVFGTMPGLAEKTVLHLKNIETGNELMFPNGRYSSITPDSRFAFFTVPANKGDTTVLVDLTSLQVKKFTGVRSFSTAGTTNVVYAYLSNDSVLHITSENQSFSVPNVTRYQLSPNGKAMIYISNGLKYESLIYRDFGTGTIDTIYRGTVFEAFNSNTTFTKFVFIVHNDTGYSIGAYDLLHSKPKLITHQSQDINYCVGKHSTVRFLQDGRSILYSTYYDYPERRKAPQQPVAKVEIWGSSDDRLYPQQKLELNKDLNQPYYFVYIPDKDSTIQITNLDVEELVLAESPAQNHAIIFTAKPYRRQKQWDPLVRKDLYHVNLSNGMRTALFKNIAADIQVSPGGQYVVWFDKEKQHYFTYHFTTGATKNISSDIKDVLANNELTLPVPGDSYGVAGWEKFDEAMLINSARNLWKVDPKGLKTPINLTKHLNRDGELVFRYYSNLKPGLSYSSDDTLLIYAHNTRTKENGYYALWHAGANARQLIFGKYNFVSSNISKADNGKIFLSFGSTDFYGLFSTADWKFFDTVYLLNPHQKQYNWYTTELIRWKVKGNQTSEAVLYMPENFDPEKKYPLIVWLYEKGHARDLYNYNVPAVSGSKIDFTYYASNGYIVLVPDIRYEIGQPGKSAADAVLSCIAYLKNRKWLDTLRMGIQSHSWGGYQAAYILTKTNRFRAAAAGAVVSNMTSAYGGIRANIGESRQWIYERHQSRIGKSLWADPDLYIKNSPLFYAHKIQTPLLLVHNEQDGGVPFAQSVELFTALKRLEKKVWLLNYPLENHVIRNMVNKKDFSKRMYQYFEHYLKDKKMPEWMENGISAIEEGYKTGY